MGKIGRIACIATPMALTVASLLCLLVVFLGGQNKGDANLSNLYYFKADTTNFKSSISATGGFTTALPNLGDGKLRGLIEGLMSTNSDKKLDDIYEIYLWNYCSGSKTNATGVNLTFCSPRTAKFWFDPVSVWGLNGTGLAKEMPLALQKGLNVYEKVSTWMFVAYALAFWTTLANVVVGIFAICSRWGSCVTAVVASVSTLFTFLAALTSTILFSTFAATFNSVLKPYGIHVTVGTKMMSLDWIAFAFSLGAGLFWTISICCCSGKSSSPSHKREKGASAGFPKPFAARGYQPLGEQHAHTGNVEMGNMGSSPYKGRETAYEPFRQT